MRKKEKGEIPMEMPGYMLVSWCRSSAQSTTSNQRVSIGEIRELPAFENAEAKFRNECEEKWTFEP